MKLLYDIYHMQIMEGDVIRTIREQHRSTSATSTPAASPAATSWTTRRSSTTRAIARAIAETGFTGYVAHEFTPSSDPLTSLREAVAVCRV